MTNYRWLIVAATFFTIIINYLDRTALNTLAIGLAAVPFASVLGAPLMSNLIASVGWRWMFLILGV